MPRCDKGEKSDDNPQGRNPSDMRMVIERVPRDEWTAFIPQAHAGYITWEECEDNQRRLLENAHAIGGDRRRSPPREGPALFKGSWCVGVAAIG